jgi:CelD/BcsL family acetyltransferase involved in cellulose biosynthesis
MNCAISELTDFGEFLAIEPEWNELLAESHCDIPFLRHEWLRTWWRHFGSPNRLAVMVGRKGGQLVFALPLMEVTNLYAGIPLTVLQSLTNQHSFRFNFIVRRGEEHAIEDFWSYLRERRRNWHLLVLQEVPSDTPLWQRATDAAQRHRYTVGVWEAYESPYLAINGQWDAFLGTRSRHFVKKLARARQLLAGAANGFSYELKGRDGWDPTAFAEALEIETRGWKGKSGTAIACDPNLTSFHTTLAQTAADQGWLRLSFLRANGARVAFEYAMEYAGHWYAMKASYDPAFRQYSPGQLLCQEILKFCFEGGIVEYDFLGPLADDKERWTGQSRKHEWLSVYNDTLLSHVHYFLNFSIKPLLKRWAVKEEK